MSIRRATFQDAIQILDLFSDTVKRINSNDYSHDQIRVWSEARNMDIWTSKILNQYFIVKETNNEIVGFSSIEKSGYIDFLYVHADYQRNGIASELLKSILDKAIHQHNKKVWASVSITAQPFFLKNGFTITSNEWNTVKGINFCNAIMEKYLNK